MADDAKERSPHRPFDPTGFAAFFPSMVAVGIACLAVALLAVATQVGTWILALALVVMILGVLSVASFMDRLTTTPGSSLGPVERGALTEDSHGDLSPHDLPQDHPARADLVRRAQQEGSPVDLTPPDAVEHKLADLARGE